MGEAAFVATQSDRTDVCLAAAGPSAAEPHRDYPPPALVAPLRGMFVEQGLVLRGVLDGCERLIVGGHVESDIAMRRIEVLEQGSFSGASMVVEAQIAGRYEGALVVAETLVVEATARIMGSVQCGRLELATGGKIEGELRVLSPASPSASADDPVLDLEALRLAASPSSEADLDHDESSATADAASGPDRIDTLAISATDVADQACMAEAESAFYAALAAKPGDVAALSGLGYVARARGQWQAALDCFDLVIAAAGENSLLSRVRAKVFRVLWPRTAAALAGDDAAEQPEQLPLPLPACAEDCVMGAAIDEAETMFRSVLKRHPRNLGALAGLGHLARRRGDREAMRKYYGAALTAEPTNLVLRVEVARAFKQLGDLAEARDILETVLGEPLGRHNEAGGGPLTS